MKTFLIELTAIVAMLAFLCVMAVAGLAAIWSAANMAFAAAGLFLAAMVLAPIGAHYAGELIQAETWN